MGLHTYLKLKSVPQNIARILICYDALLQLRQKKVRARKGKYVVVKKKNAGDSWTPTINLKNKLNQQIDSVLDKQQCEACALGTLFISRARIFNQIKVGDIPNFQYGEITFDASQSSLTLFKDLQSYFSSEQLSLIESCFEGEPIGIAGQTSCYNNDIRGISERYLNKYKTAESRLIAILKNIIKNNGLFIPQQNISRNRKKKVDKKETVVKQNQGE